MRIKRALRHLTATRWHVQRAFPVDVLDAIESAIADSEGEHRGEIQFAVEGALEPAALFKGQSARERAVEVFANLRVWDTEENTGVLIYLLLADRDVEILVDRGLASKVDAAEWESICRDMETAFRQGRYREGVLAAIQAVTHRLRQHFPPRVGDINELPNKPLLL